MKVLRIGTRASALARWQAESVLAGLAEAGIASELVLIRTAGDRDQTSSLRATDGKGFFIKELEEALLDERVDLAVHSMKDVPTEMASGLAIAAFCRRHDVRDALVSRSGLGLSQLPPAARVGTSSPRRQAQLRRCRADLDLVEIRGNVDTRLAKVSGGDYDAVVLAKAGLDRLGLADHITEIISTDICLPAAGQGAIGVETRAVDHIVLGMIGTLDDLETRIAVEAERTVLAELGGGCQVPVGVWAHIEARELVIEACVLAIDGSESVRVRRAGSPQDSQGLGHEVATTLISRGAGQLLQFAGPGVGGASRRGANFGGAHLGDK